MISYFIKYLNILKLLLEEFTFEILCLDDMTGCLSVCYKQGWVSYGDINYWVSLQINLVVSNYFSQLVQFNQCFGLFTFLKSGTKLHMYLDIVNF